MPFPPTAFSPNPDTKKTRSRTYRGHLRGADSPQAMSYQALGAGTLQAQTKARSQRQRPKPNYVDLPNQCWTDVEARRGQPGRSPNVEVDK